MLATIRSEFRKLLTVRSTYFIFGISLLIVVFFAGFVEGVKGDPANMLANGKLLMSESTNAVTFTGLILAFAGLLLAGHEYRYNTIMYTLTAANRRYKVILAKFVAISAFAVIASLIITFWSPLCTIIGANLAGKEIGPQTFQVWDVVWRCVFCGWGYAMYAFILLMVLRSQVGAIVTFLLFPLIGEPIIGLLLKQNVKYLPFSALQSVPGQVTAHMHAVSNMPGIVLLYVVGGLLISWILFTKRDAN